MLGLLAQTYTYTTTTVDEGSGILGFLAAYFLFGLVVWALAIVALWKVFEKAGIPGWKAIIPFYNGWLVMEMAGKPGWWALVSLGGIVPVLGFLASIAALVLWVIAALELGKAFGKSQVFSIVGLIIFSVIGLLMLGFGDDKYKKPATAPANFS